MRWCVLLGELRSQHSSAWYRACRPTVGQVVPAGRATVWASPQLQGEAASRWHGLGAMKGLWAAHMGRAWTDAKWPGLDANSIWNRDASPWLYSTVFICNQFNLFTRAIIAFSITNLIIWKSVTSPGHFSCREKHENNTKWRESCQGIIFTLLI